MLDRIIGKQWWHATQQRHNGSGAFFTARRSLTKAELPPNAYLAPAPQKRQQLPCPLRSRPQAPGPPAHTHTHAHPSRPPATPPASQQQPLRHTPPLRLPSPPPPRAGPAWTASGRRPVSRNGSSKRPPAATPAAHPRLPQPRLLRPPLPLLPAAGGAGPRAGYAAACGARGRAGGRGDGAGGGPTLQAHRGAGDPRRVSGVHSAGRNGSSQASDRARRRECLCALAA